MVTANIKDWGKILVTALVTAIGTTASLAYVYGVQSTQTVHQIQQNTKLIQTNTANVQILTETVTDLKEWRIEVNSTNFTSSDAADLISMINESQRQMTKALADLTTEVALLRQDVRRQKN